MIPVPIVRRTDYLSGHFQLIGFELDRREAAELVSEGRGVFDVLEAPTQIYVLHSTLVRGRLLVAGTIAHTGRDLSGAEAIALLRGNTARGEPAATVPGGAVG